MFFFSHRVKLEKLYREWLEKEQAKDCPVSFIAFLQLKGLLNEDKALIFVTEETKEKKDD